MVDPQYINVNNVVNPNVNESNCFSILRNRIFNQIITIPTNETMSNTLIAVGFFDTFGPFMKLSISPGKPGVLYELTLKELRSSYNSIRS